MSSMPSMPDNGATGDQGRAQQTARPDVPAQGPAPQDQPMAAAPPPYGETRRPRMVPEAETRVTGRRIVQYIVDHILAGIVPGIAYWVFDNEVNGIHGLGWLVATVVAAAAYFAYWVLIPYSHRGQSFGMQLFRLHVISKDGDKASMMQLLVRGIFLILDTLIFGLVGLITMLVSRFRQRIGDHAAGTVVVPARYGSQA